MTQPLSNFKGRNVLVLGSVHSQRLGSYCDDIETWNQEEIPLSARGLSVAEVPHTPIQRRVLVCSDLVTLLHTYGRKYLVGKK